MKTLFALWIASGFVLAMAATATPTDGGYTWRTKNWTMHVARVGFASAWFGRYDSWLEHDVSVSWVYWDIGKLQVWNRRISWDSKGFHYDDFMRGLR